MLLLTIAVVQTASHETRGMEDDRMQTVDDGDAGCGWASDPPGGVADDGTQDSTGPVTGPDTYDDHWDGGPEIGPAMALLKLAMWRA